MNRGAVSLLLVLPILACEPPREAYECAPDAAVPAPSVSSLEDVLLAMRDDDRLMRFDDSLVSVRLTSSFDRASLTGDWFANRDAGNYLESHGDEHVLFDADGPGIVTRIWSANPRGALRIEIDGATVIDGPMVDVLAGLDLGLEDEHAFVAARGHNLYLPIPYQSHARIVATLEGGLYYHVTYQTLDPSVVVEPFSREGFARARCEVGEPAPLPSYEGEILSHDPDVRLPSARTLLATTLDSATAEPLVLRAPTGGGVIRELRFDAGALDAAALRGTELRVIVDGEPTVIVPLGDLFMGGPGPRTFDSRMVSASEDGRLVSRWPMPFRDEMQIALRAANTPAVEVPLRVVVDARPFDADTLLFRARFQPPTQIQVNDATGAATPLDLRLLDIEGRGFYAGVMLNVANPTTSWWGEGDEKVFVDGEAFPSHFGTGTEDYFGWAWCSTEQFAFPLEGQLRTRNDNNAGYITAYRWHALDAIPFRTSLRFDLEVLHWGVMNPPSEVTYDAVVLFYAAPGAVIHGASATDADYLIPTLPDEALGPGLPGAPYRCGGG